MSNIVSKIRQRIALKDKNKFDLSCDHFTTGDFMQLSPVFIQEMVPGENINVKEQVFTRLAPLVKPMYGRARIELRKFFVPMRTIKEGWNEYITDTTVDGVIPSLPTIALRNIASALTHIAFAYTVAADVAAYDFIVGTTKYKWNATGKQVWKILNSLGYRFPIGYWASQTQVTTPESRVSALPLLAYLKVYNDWYKNQAYNDPTFFGLFKGIGSTTLDDTDKLLAVFQAMTKVTYDKDELFVSAWDKPTTPNDGLTSSISIPDVTNDVAANPIFKGVVSNQAVAGNAHPTAPIIGNQDETAANNVQARNVTQYCIDALKSLTDYVKRHQLAGSLAMDRYLSRFGIKLNSVETNRSIYLGKNTIDVQIADVMATANGQDGNDQSSAVGDYAGKGVGYNDGGISYSTDEFGYLIFCASIIPSAHYVQGMNPQVWRGLNGRLDFYTPEFDKLGVEALPRKALLADYNGNGAEGHLALTSVTYEKAMDGIFGFVPRYATYKAAFDNLTGDFVVPSMNAGMNNSVWHLNRMFDPSTIALSGITHNKDFVNAADAGQYDRIFAIQSEDDNVANKLDHFYTIYHFEVEAYKPMSRLFDDYDFDGGNKDVTIEVNGTQLN